MNFFEQNMSANIAAIGTIGLPRQPKLFSRRLFKLGEELGEVAEAYLAITGTHNYKLLTPFDLREEVIDTFAIAADLMYIWLEHSTGFSLSNCHRCINAEFVAQTKVRAPSTSFEENMGRVFVNYGRMLTAYTPGLPSGLDAAKPARVVIWRQNPTEEFFKSVCALVMTDVPHAAQVSDVEMQYAISDLLATKLQKWASTTGKTVPYPAFELMPA